MLKKFFEKILKKVLTTGRFSAKILLASRKTPDASDENPGEMSERFKELVLKTSDSERGRGFESHSLRSIFPFIYKL